MSDGVSQDRSYPRTAKVASSGDILLDRRRQWALAASADGFHQAAVEIYEQIVDRAPYWAVAWLELGDARLASGDRHGAIRAYEAAAKRDAQGVLAAQLKLAALGAADTPSAPPASYVAGLFDQYAEKFDAHLVGTLEYRGPQVLREAMQRACAQDGRAFRFGAALDLGCGTGLMGVAIRDLCDAIDGVDLSARMIDAARRTQAYRTLATGDVVAWLDAQPRAAADLVVAADVFVYLGDLAPVFAAAAAALCAGGLFAFSAQKGDGADFAVGADMRYAHGEDYLRRLAARHGFGVAAIDDVSTRRDRDAPVPGLIAVMVRS